MPSFTVRNKNYRDETAKVPYPFDVFFSGELGSVNIDMDTLLDACFFFKGNVTLPVHVSAVDGLYGTEYEVRLIITDAQGENVASAVVMEGDSITLVQDNLGAKVGILTWDPGRVSDLITQSKGQYIETLIEESTFSIDVCRVMKAPRPTHMSVDGMLLQGTVEIQARHGVRWRDEGTSLHLDILGDIPEDGDTRQPVLSINGVTNSTIWLNTTPESNLRIDTDSEAVIFGQAKDITS